MVDRWAHHAAFAIDLLLIEHALSDALRAIADKGGMELPDPIISPQGWRMKVLHFNVHLLYVRVIRHR